MWALSYKEMMHEITRVNLRRGGGESDGYLSLAGGGIGIFFLDFK